MTIDTRARVTLVALVALLPVAVGCTSNEYVIPHEELVRLAKMRPSRRGERVRVVQDLGRRRGDAVPPETDSPDESVRIDVSGNGGRGARVAGGGHAGGGHAGGGVRAPAIGHAGGGGGGGGGGNGDAALVAIIVVVAVVVAIGLVSSEGVRFDGFVAMSPEQPIHLRAPGGQREVISMSDLTVAWADETAEAKVMDDEGFGLARLDDVALDRRGMTFKLDAGSIAFDVAGVRSMGPAMQVQAGYFFGRRVGLLASLGLAGASATSGGVTALVPRHALALELQAFPLSAGRFHLGFFGNGGMALSETLQDGVASYVSGLSVGGGALAEVDVTSRMALTLRAGGNLAKLDQAWTPAGLLTAGVAVY
ncbi:MAG TPA: hypothetical protein VMT03_27285 [Polyangia bacterium]|nr:hypothetical protein [Polyangia bacterium]